MINLKELPVEVGPMFEGERVRKGNMFVELGGPKVANKAELLLVKDANEIDNEKVTVIGKDIPEFEEGTSIPFGIFIEVAGEKLTRDIEAVFERRVHDFFNFVAGVMHLNQRYDIWCRISKDAIKKGLNFEVLGKALMGLYHAEYEPVEKIQVTFITDPGKVEEHLKFAKNIYKERDEKTRGMKDTDIDTFYTCSLCQSFAPNHICVVTPERISLCGALTWMDCKAASELDPEGPNQAIPVTESLDSINGEWEPVNEVVKEYSHGNNERFYLYSMFGYPHTSCGCFECILFYVPEVDGIGLVDRNFRGPAVNGLKFSQMAGQTGGGEQTVGFLGAGIQWMTSKRFISADGVEGYEVDEKYSPGWSRVVWLPSYLKEKFSEYIPEDLRDRIATEKTVESIDALKDFLGKKGHSVVATWKEEQEAEAESELEGGALAGYEFGEAIEGGAYAVPSMGIPMGGYEVILKNATITAERVIIKKLDAKGKGKK